MNAPYRTHDDPIARRPARWQVVVRVAGRALFVAMVLCTATAAGALFVAWPTQPESRTSIHMSVGARVLEASR